MENAEVIECHHGVLFGEKSKKVEVSILTMTSKNIMWIVIQQLPIKQDINIMIEEVRLQTRMKVSPEIVKALNRFYSVTLLRMMRQEEVFPY